MQENQYNYGLVYVTVPSLELAEKIARVLLTERLAACISFFPVESRFIWKEAVCCEQEYQLMIKTDLSLFTSLKETIESLHPYDVPEIIGGKIESISLPYLRWLQETIKKE